MFAVRFFAAISIAFVGLVFAAWAEGQEGQATPESAPMAEKTTSVPVSAEARTKAKRWVRELEKGWTIDAELEHDFDADGVLDLALVLREKPAEDTQGRRRLVIGMGQSGGEYRPVISNSCMVYCVECGGIMGDPFQGMTLRGGSKKAGPDGSMTVVGGSLVVANWGGSRQRWAHSFTLAWRKGRFVVAGFDNYLEDILDPGSLRETSVNLLSGRFTRKKGAKEDAPKRHPNRPFPAEDCGSIDALITAFSP